MWNWIKMLFHQHKWKIIKEANLDWLDENDRVVKTGMSYHIQCEYCGTIKNIRTGNNFL